MRTVVHSTSVLVRGRSVVATASQVGLDEVRAVAASGRDLVEVRSSLGDELLARLSATRIGGEDAIPQFSERDRHDPIGCPRSGPAIVVA